MMETGIISIRSTLQFNAFLIKVSFARCFFYLFIYFL